MNRFKLLQIHQRLEDIALEVLGPQRYLPGDVDIIIVCGDLQQQARPSHQKPVYKLVHDDRAGSNSRMIK